MKIASFTTVTGPYIVARYSAFYQRLAKNYDFSLIELGKTSNIYQWNTNLKTDYKRIILSDKPVESQLFLTLFQNLNGILKKLNPDVLILCGYSLPIVIYLLLWGRWHHKAIIILSDSKYDDDVRYWWKEIFKSFLLKQCQSALVAGKIHQQYLVKLGLPLEAIFLGYDIVNNNVFDPNKIRDLPPPLNRSYFLAVNRFISKKNLALLISAYADYRQQAGEVAWDLVLSGDGQLRGQIERQVQSLDLTECVHLPGFLQQEDLLPYFAHASCFIHASIQEQWGLVVNEAMAAGLPVLVSNRCGCFEDLVIEGVNGFGFDPEDENTLTQLMLKMSSSDVDLAAMGEASLQHIQKYSPDYFAQGLMQAMEYSLAHL